MKAAWALVVLLCSDATAASFEQSLNSGFGAVGTFSAAAAEAVEPDDLQGELELAAKEPLPDNVDLSHYWADGPRDQKPLLTCHTFAAVGLLEAGYYRMTGKHVRLSEADLFARATALRGLRSVVVPQNGLLREDLRIGIETGVAPGDWYAELSKRLADFGPWDPVLLGKERGLQVLLPEATTPLARAARERMAGAFGRLELQSESVLRYAGTAVREIIKGKAVSCRVKTKRRDRIMRRLAAGIPVGAGILLNGVSDPDLNAQRDSVGGQHYVILTGYERRENGVVFKMRNSWGKRPGWNAVLTEPDLCALFALTWATLPGDPR